MKEIILKRNKLLENAIKLRELKYDPSTSKKRGFELNEEKEKIDKKFNFYNNYIKAMEGAKK